MPSAEPATGADRQRRGARRRERSRRRRPAAVQVSCNGRGAIRRRRRAAAAPRRCTLARRRSAFRAPGMRGGASQRRRRRAWQACGAAGTAAATGVAAAAPPARRSGACATGTCRAGGGAASGALHGRQAIVQFRQAGELPWRHRLQVEELIGQRLQPLRIVQQRPFGVQQPRLLAQRVRCAHGLLDLAVEQLHPMLRLIEIQTGTAGQQEADAGDRTDHGTIARIRMRSSARSRALRARGLAAVSAGPGRIGRAVSRRKRGAGAGGQPARIVARRRRRCGRPPRS